jgi:hypothetical protein
MLARLEVQLKALRVLKQCIAGAGEDDPAAIERELAALRAKIAQHQAAAETLAGEWRDADNSDAAEQVDRRRREALRMLERARSAPRDAGGDFPQGCARRSTRRRKFKWKPLPRATPPGGKSGRLPRSIYRPSPTWDFCSRT